MMKCSCLCNLCAEKVLSDLGEISQWLVTNTNKLDFMNSYATIRAETLHRSLIGYEH